MYNVLYSQSSYITHPTVPPPPLRLDVMSKHSSSKVTSQQVDLAMLLYRIPRITQTWQRYANHFSGGTTNSMTGGATRDPMNVGYRFPSGKRIDLLDFREMRRKASMLKTQLTDVRNARKAQRERYVVTQRHHS